MNRKEMQEKKAELKSLVRRARAGAKGVADDIKKKTAPSDYEMNQNIKNAQAKHNK